MALSFMLTAQSCRNASQKEAEQLMQEIRADYDSGNDSACLAAIDTLRARCPKAVAERKEALGYYQKASLRIAQTTLARTDSALEVAKAQYQHMQQEVNAHKAAGNATANELTALTLMRMHRDSLQTQFDVLCAQIKYIHKRQKQYGN